MNAQSQLTPFNFNQTAVRVINRNGEAWFIAKDVAAALGYSHVPHALRILDDDEKDVHIVDTRGGNQEMAIINESGVYALVLKSRKPEAKPFRKWVTSEVLPAIRKTGVYHYGNLSAWIDPQRKLHLRRLVEHRANYLKCSTQKIWGEVRFVTGAGGIHEFTQAEYEEAVAYLGGFPIRGRQAERFPVPVTQAEINNFRSFMQVFREVVDEAGFLRELSKSLGSSKLLSLWSLIDSANFMSGTAECIEARLIGVGMESSPSLCV